MSTKAIFSNKLKFIPDMYSNGAKIVGVKNGQAPFYEISAGSNGLNFESYDTGMVFGNKVITKWNSRIWGSFEYQNDVFVIVYYDRGNNHYTQEMAILKASDLIIQNGGVIRLLLNHIYQQFKAFTTRKVVGAL